MHDPAIFEDPYVFRPERFLRDGKPDPSVPDPIPFVFGFGRRLVESFSSLQRCGAHDSHECF